VPFHSEKSRVPRVFGLQMSLRTSPGQKCTTALKKWSIEGGDPPRRGGSLLSPWASPAAGEEGVAPRLQGLVRRGCRLVGLAGRAGEEEGVWQGYPVARVEGRIRSWKGSELG